jgi:predicted transcriptional regulator
MTSKYIYRYRNRIDIIAELLNVACGGTTKTKMMYKVMLSYGQLKEYLQILTENDLIVYDNANQRFSTTHKGFEFVKRYEDLSKFIHPIATPIVVKKEKSSSMPS